MHKLPETGLIRLKRIIGGPKTIPPIPVIIPICLEHIGGKV